jgi:S-methylmethionine-dependent homocysteine/selenocysteine methylase
VTISPEDYAALAKSWLEPGVQVIGGCCGLGVDHIKALKRLF